MSDLLAAGRLPPARERLTHLVGRDTSALDEHEIARAVVESVAENTSDAVVAPLVLGALLGVPGLLAYRAANTLDAMVGHRSARYAEFGWASARLDDLLNLPGSRLTALLTTLLGPSPRGPSPPGAATPPAHPSPNAGPVEAAFAGALGIRSAAPTATAPAPSTAPSSAPAAPPTPPTSRARPTWPGGSISPLRALPRPSRASGRGR